MGLVMIRCPVTGHEISTGLEASELSFNHSPVFSAAHSVRFAEGITSGSQKTLGFMNRRRNIN